MKRWMILLYGLACYALTLATLSYLAGFVGNFLVPRPLDSIAEGNLITAGVIDLLLVGVFALQHSLMARPAFKAWLVRYIPQEAERSTYVLFSCLVLILMFVAWQPLGIGIWNLQSTPLVVGMYVLFAAGWATIFATTFLINHFDLFGLRQVWLCFRGQPYTQLPFKQPSVYRVVRHPLYVGWLTAVWAAPTMTLAHLVFAGGITIYILAAIRLEERDLEDLHGEDYAAYRRNVPMLIPRLARSTMR